MDLATDMKVAPQNLEELKYDTISSWEEKQETECCVGMSLHYWVTNIISKKKKPK